MMVTVGRKNSTLMKATDEEDRRTSSRVICALCLEVFRNPKLLSCHHSFCEECLTNLAAEHQGGLLPCPMCRETTVLPSGGVSALQTNFHLDSDELERARGGSLCPTHHNKELELVCVQCQTPICSKCVPEHNQHEFIEIHKAAEPARQQLCEDQDRLQCYVEKLKRQIQAAEQEQKVVTEKKSVVEQDIHNRHALIVAEADKYRDMALESLEKVTQDIESELGLKSFRQQLQTLGRLQKQVQHALDSGTASQLLGTSREMKTGKGSEQVMQAIHTRFLPGQSFICCPVLHFSSLTSPVFNSMRDFVGSARMIRMPHSPHDGTLEEMFRCGTNNNDLEVFSICPFYDGVWVAFEPSPKLGELPACKFDYAGALLETSEEYTGRVTVTLARYSESFAALKSKPGDHLTYAKKSRFILQSHTLGTLGWSKINNEDDVYLPKKERKVHRINCRAHRVFDANRINELFAVIKEKQHTGFHPRSAKHDACVAEPGRQLAWKNGEQRKVRLYRKGEYKTISKYKPPVTPWRPTDVCFYVLNGEEVLLVADELNDAIHVVHVQTKSPSLLNFGNKINYELIFARYLVPGSPLLVQPTALNTDAENRLWIACRGGRILTFKPSAQNQGGTLGDGRISSVSW